MGYGPHYFFPVLPPLLHSLGFSPTGLASLAHHASLAGIFSHAAGSACDFKWQVHSCRLGDCLNIPSAKWPSLIMQVWTTLSHLPRFAFLKALITT